MRNLFLQATGQVPAALHDEAPFHEIGLTSLAILNFNERIQPVFPDLNKTLRSTCPSAAGRPDIAIVGLHGRFHDADNLDPLRWNLLQGLDSISAIPGERWPLKGFFQAGADARQRSVGQRWLRDRKLKDTIRLEHQAALKADSPSVELMYLKIVVIDVSEWTLLERKKRPKPLFLGFLQTSMEAYRKIFGAGNETRIWRPTH